MAINMRLTLGQQQLVLQILTSHGLGVFTFEFGQLGILFFMGSDNHVSLGIEVALGCATNRPGIEDNVACISERSEWTRNVRKSIKYDSVTRLSEKISRRHHKIRMCGGTVFKLLLSNKACTCLLDYEKSWCRTQS